MAQEFFARVQQKTDTTAGWSTSSVILKEGELGVEKKTDGTYRIKIGDGVSTFAVLKYESGDAIINYIKDGLVEGSVRTSNSAVEDTNYRLGNSAFATGYGTKASGNFSTAAGQNTQAKGAYSHAQNRGTVASGSAQTAIGKYNVEDSNGEYAFIIGDGSNSAPSNLLTVSWDGVISIKGKALATEEYVNENGGKIQTVQVNGQDLTITDKSVNIEIPEKVSQLENDSKFVTQTYVGEQINAIPLNNYAQKATTLSGYGIEDTYTKDETNAQIISKIEALDVEDTSINGQYVSSVSETNGKIIVSRTALPSQTDYSVTITESTPEGYAKAYTITQASTGLNVVMNIPKDMVVSSGIVEHKDTSGEWGLAGDYLVLTLANATSDKVYINVSSLIEYVTSGSAANDQIVIAVSEDHKVTATLSNASVTKEQLVVELQTQITKLESVEEGAQKNVQSDWNATSGDAMILNKPIIPTIQLIIWEENDGEVI